MRLLLAGLSAVMVATAFLSGVFGMAGGLVPVGVLLALLPWPAAAACQAVDPAPLIGARRKGPATLTARPCWPAEAGTAIPFHRQGRALGIRPGAMAMSAIAHRRHHTAGAFRAGS